MSSDKYDWRARHRVAMANPNDLERPYVAVVDAIEDLSNQIGCDNVLSPGIAELIEGVRTLLNGDLGNRLDKGTIDGLLHRAAFRIGYCMDHSEFDSCTTTEGHQS